MNREAASDGSYWGSAAAHPQRPNPGMGRRDGASSGEAHLAGKPAADVSKELNRQITQASSMQELLHVVAANFNNMNGVNLCTAYHRLARHAQDQRQPLERLPPQMMAQLGGLISRLNAALIPIVSQVQAQNLGITLWSMSKLGRVPQSRAPQLIDALQQEVVNRLQNVTHQVYMTDKHYRFGAQSLSNVIYAAAFTNRRLDYNLLHLVAKAIEWQIEEFKPQGLANTVWSLGKLGSKLTFEVRQLVDACSKEMYNQLVHQRYKGTFAPQNISNALHGLAKLGFQPSPDLLAALATCAGEQLRHFGPQELTNMVWGYAQLAMNGAVLPQEVQVLINRVADELSLYLQDRQWRTKVRPQTISNITWAFAKLKRCPQKLNQDMVREALQLLPQFKPQELSNLLWALATMGHYPGPRVIDTLVQATCAVCTDMKPQELANTAWALATLRHFPGPQALDAYIQHAANTLDRFKSQEIGNLLWALARLGYMPAAGFALAVMPFIQDWRQTDVQDCGNLLWAFMILDVLTPEAVQLLGERLRALPPQQFTQESYIQIYQAKMAMSQKVATIAQHIPSELLRQAELEWRKQTSHNRISKTHREVSETLSQLSEPHELEKRIEDGLLSVDLALTNRLVAVEVDGSSHFSVNEPFVPLGKSVLRWRILASRGWRVVTVPFYRWAVLRTLNERKEFLWRLLQCNNVWECLSVDPADRDSPPVYPANMAHITPDDEIEDLRSYFAQVTGVSSVPPTSVAEVPSVEQVVMRVLALPSDRPVSDLAPCFKEWEGERFAQLLSALGGQQARSVQLFDWVRGLPPDDPLSPLCCPASYAAMMSLHGQWRQPGRALRLLSGAKARGVDLGAEIYAALVQAMCRCGQYEVASDAFQHMLTQQLPVDSAVFRSVLSSYLERGLWEEVLHLLDSMQSHNADVDAETYQLAISGAADAGERGALMSIYHHMCGAGVPPSCDTFIKLLDLILQWESCTEDAAELLLSLAAQAPEGADSLPDSNEFEESPPPPSPLLSLLRACRATGQWQLSRHVLAGADQHGFPPSLPATNQVIATAAQCGLAQQAQETFDGMEADGLTPDGGSHRALVEAYLQAGDWLQACIKYEAAVAAGHPLPSSTCGAVVAALWGTGLPWAQAKAGVMHKELLSSGSLDAPIVTYSRGVIKVDLNVLDPGAGPLALYYWLLQLRDSIGNSQSSGLLEEHRRLVVVNGSSGSSAQGRIAAEVKGAVGSCLVTHRSPFRLSLDSGRACKLEASAQMVKKWLFTESFQGWCRVLSGEEGLAGTPLSLDSLPAVSAWREQEEGGRQECQRVFSTIRSYEMRLEKEAAGGEDCTEVYRSRRRALISKAYTLIQRDLQLQHPLQVWYTTTAVLDRVGRRGYLPPSDTLLAAACVVTAAAQEGAAVDPSALTEGLDYKGVVDATGLPPAAALDAEVSHVAAVLGGDTSCTSPFCCLMLYADRLGLALGNTAQLKAVMGDCQGTLNKLVTDDVSLQYPTSIQAAAVVYASRKQAGVLPFWPSVLHDLTGYDDRTHQQFADAVSRFERPVLYGPMVVAEVFS